MSFTGNWKVRPGCCPPQPDLPSPPQNLAILEISGYFYRTIPTWFDSTGQRMLNLQFSADFNMMWYRWKFYRKVGDLCNNIYYLSTSEDIVPVIHEIISGRRLRVERISHHNGYTTWRVTC